MKCFFFLDGKNTYSSKRKLRTDMISAPQGDCKHMGHVGMDGAYFGDISFLGGKVTKKKTLSTFMTLRITVDPTIILGFTIFLNPGVPASLTLPLAL